MSVFNLFVICLFDDSINYPPPSLNGMWLEEQAMNTQSVRIITLIQVAL